MVEAFLVEGQRVDLIYLDPPFNSNVDHSMLFKRDTQGQDINEQARFTAFQDTKFMFIQGDMIVIVISRRLEVVQVLICSTYYACVAY